MFSQIAIHFQFKNELKIVQYGKNQLRKKLVSNSDIFERNRNIINLGNHIIINKKVIMIGLSFIQIVFNESYALMISLLSRPIYNSAFRS